jgi:DnaK suppressor protein
VKAGSNRENSGNLKFVAMTASVAAKAGETYRNGMFDSEDRKEQAEAARPELPPGYVPSERESFMGPLQREYFRQKLLRWRAELLRESTETLQHLKEDTLSQPDLTDRASLETDRSLELRTRDRERKLIAKIDAALERIEDGSYGYCEETSEPIGLRRLEARPIATLSLEAQERHERMERTHRDD